MSSRLAPAAVLVITLTLLLAPPASAGPASTAALQVELRAKGLYPGHVDGVAGPGTRAGIRRLQRRHRIGVDGVVGPRTLRALGRRGRPRLGSRVMKTGQRGWDVAALQFLLTRRGFSPGGIDGRRRAQHGLRREALPERGGDRRRRARGAGHPALAAPPLGAEAPHLQAGLEPGIRPGAVPTPGARRDGRRLRLALGPLHTGIDFPAPAGTPIGAAGRGVVKFAGWNSGGYGNLVVVTHRLGFETWYAHQSRIAVRAGQAVTGGSRIGFVGSTGHSTGPHLHFEVRLNGTPIDPAPRLLGSYAARVSRSSRPLECRGSGPLEGRGKSPRSSVLAGCRH